MNAKMLVDSNGLVIGKRHIVADDCLALVKEQRLNPTATLVDTRIKKRDIPYICRTCFYTLAEMSGINCFDICLTPGKSHDCVLHHIKNGNN